MSQGVKVSQACEFDLSAGAEYNDRSMFNVTPEGPEALAVSIEYERIVNAA